jgi:hypothetical protein
MKRINGTDVNITREDQNSINNFSKLYQRRQDLDEIDLNDDEEVLRYRFGGCFFYLPSTPSRIQPIRCAHSCRRTSRRSRRKARRPTKTETTPINDSGS